MTIDSDYYNATQLEDLYKSPFALAANKSNQDILTYREAITGKYAGEFDEY